MFKLNNFWFMVIFNYYQINNFSIHSLCIY